MMSELDESGQSDIEGFKALRVPYLESRDLEVSFRMEEAGLDVLRRSGAVEIELDSDRELVADIFRAMATALGSQASR